MEFASNVCSEKNVRPPRPRRSSGSNARHLRRHAWDRRRRLHRTWTNQVRLRTTKTATTRNSSQQSGVDYRGVLWREFEHRAVILGTALLRQAVNVARKIKRNSALRMLPIGTAGLAT